MSESILRFIPTVPSLVASPDRRRRALALAVATFPRARVITFEVSDGIQFLDCGSNVDYIRCPRCKASLDGAWADAMEAAYSLDRFGDLDWTTPCCSCPTTLNDLDYSWPMGFARSTLEIADPREDLPADFTARIVEILGFELRVIWAHY